jgi:hypothetical protein
MVAVRGPACNRCCVGSGACALEGPYRGAIQDGGQRQPVRRGAPPTPPHQHMRAHATHCQRHHITHARTHTHACAHTRARAHKCTCWPTAPPLTATARRPAAAQLGRAHGDVPLPAASRQRRLHAAAAVLQLQGSAAASAGGGRNGRRPAAAPGGLRVCGARPYACQPWPAAHHRPAMRQEDGGQAGWLAAVVGAHVGLMAPS